MPDSARVPALCRTLGGPLINTISSRLVKNDEMQGARMLRNEEYIHIQYAEMTKDAA